MQRRIRTAALRFLAAVVIALHAGFLWQRIRDLSITDPAVLARWCAAAIVAILALLLLRLRVSRRAWLVFWIAVLVLHAAPAQPETILAIAPLLFLIAVCALTLPSASAPLRDTSRTTLYIDSFALTLPSRAPPFLRECSS